MRRGEIRCQNGNPRKNMKSWRVLALFGICCLLASQVTAADWVRLESGLSYRKIEIHKRSSKVPYALHAFKIDPKKYDLRPLTAAPETYASIRRMVENSGALVGVNANFFDPHGKPLGLIISNGQEINPYRPVSWWGVFYIEKGIPHIVSGNQWRKSPGVTIAIQTGPRLISKGRTLRLKAESSQKTAVGITKNGEVILVSTLFPIDINELARLMVGSAQRGGLECVEALNLDGGSSSQMYAKVGSFELRLPSYVGIPVGLGVFRR